MIVVSDASPLITLAAAGQLHLLNQLYGKVIVPPAVYREITSGKANAPGAEQILASPWIESTTITNQPVASTLHQSLGAGEAEAVTLALQVRADILLMDERLGRKLAENLGIKVIGLLGTVIEAKKKGLIPKVKPVLDELRTKTSFWVSENLYQRILIIAGE